MSDVITVTEQIRQAARDLQEATAQIQEAARKKAETERDYRVRLAKEIVKLRESGVPVSIVNDLAKASSADELFARDLADVEYRATLEAIESQRAQLSALQSALKYME